MSEREREECADASAPDGHHERLAAFEGRFRAEVKLWMGPGEPAVMTGTMVNTMELGGRFLHQAYEGDATEGPFPRFRGRGYWGYNRARGAYEGFWIDTASTMMQTESGQVDAAGRVWTMIGELTGPGDRKCVKRSVITLQDRDHHLMEMFFDQGEGEAKSMEIRYTRA